MARESGRYWCPACGAWFAPSDTDLGARAFLEPGAKLPLGCTECRQGVAYAWPDGSQVPPLRRCPSCEGQVGWVASHGAFGCGTCGDMWRTKAELDRDVRVAMAASEDFARFYTEQEGDLWPTPTSIADPYEGW